MVCGQKPRDFCKEFGMEEIKNENEVLTEEPATEDAIEEVAVDEVAEDGKKGRQRRSRYCAPVPEAGRAHRLSSVPHGQRV